MRRLGFALVSLLVGIASSASACSSSTVTGAPASDASPPLEAAVGGFALELGCTDAIDAIYTDPGALPALDDSSRGAIVKCAVDVALTKEALQAEATRIGYTGRPFTSGARVYRILYRTERGNSPPTAGYSSALVLLPDNPRAGAGLPVIVASHGSRGQGSRCTASKADPVDDGVKGDFEAQVFSIVGGGYAVIAPDLAGYAAYGAANNPPSAYALTADVGKSTLDGARALRKLVPHSVSDKVVLVGHSQGGHTALSAHALAQTYGAGGTLVGTAVYAPLWWNEATFGALLALPTTYPIATDPTVNAVSVWYHYTHAELLDGTGHGGDIFQHPADIKAFVDGTCWGSPYPALQAHGEATALDIYKPEFVASVKNMAALGAGCPMTDGGASDPVCETWKKRYADDRPHLTGAAASTPIFLLYGGADTTIPPGRMSCVLERLHKDNANFSVCWDRSADHGGVVRAHADYVNDWIASVALGAQMPAPCAQGESAIVDDAGSPIPCDTPPPND
jgi:pimeloyl-ACP methyl ester carboxylesterase